MFYDHFSARSLLAKLGRFQFHVRKGTGNLVVPEPELLFSPIRLGYLKHLARTELNVM